MAWCTTRARSSSSRASSAASTRWLSRIRSLAGHVCMTAWRANSCRKLTAPAPHLHDAAALGLAQPGQLAQQGASQPELDP